MEAHAKKNDTLLLVEDNLKLLERK